MNKSLWVAAALAVACGTASAQSYGGAILGITQFNCSPIGCNDKTDTGYKVYGGRRLSDQWSMELAYTQFGKARLSDGDSVDASAVSVLGALRLPISTDFTGVVRLGVAYVTKDFVLREYDATVAAYGGLGLEYAMNQNIKLQAVVDTTDHGKGKLFGLGLQAGF